MSFHFIWRSYSAAGIRRSEELLLEESGSNPHGRWEMHNFLCPLFDLSFCSSSFPPVPLLCCRYQPVRRAALGGVAQIRTAVAEMGRAKMRMSLFFAVLFHVILFHSIPFRAATLQQTSAGRRSFSGRRSGSNPHGSCASGTCSRISDGRWTMLTSCWTRHGGQVRGSY